jgi:hypothetical protein
VLWAPALSALAILRALFVTVHGLIALFRRYRHDARGNLEILHCFVGQRAAGSKGNRQDRCCAQPVGLDSAMLVYLMIELEEKLSSELSPDDFYDYPTVNDRSRYLAERLATRAAG